MNAQTDYTVKVEAIHAASGWEQKIGLFKLAFPKSGFKTFWIQFGYNDAGEQRIARSLFARAQ